MGDDFKRVQRGDSLRIPAQTFNTMLDATELVMRGRQSGGRGQKPGQTRMGEVPVKNDTGGDLDRFAVVAIDSVIYSPTDNAAEFKSRPSFVGDTPTSGDEGRFAILQAPCANGKIAPGVVAGISPVKVNVTDDSHNYAEIADGDTAKLVSGAGGSATILWKESGTGEKWAVVRLGNPACAVCRFQLAADITGTGGFSALKVDASGSTGDTITVYNSLGLHLWAKTGAQGYARWMSDATGGGRWEILHMMHKARFIRFTADEAFTSSDSSFSATLADYWDGSNPDPAAAGLTISNTCASSGRYGECGLARLDEIDNIYRLASATGSSTLRWAKAQYDWSANSGDPRVEVKACDRDGTNETGDNFYVYLPRSTSGDPAVFEDNVIGYTVDVEGTCICVTDYMDDAIGTVKMWKETSGDVPAGWRICDGSDGSLNFSGRFPVGVNSSRSDEDTVGDTGGHRWHGDSENWHLPQDHPNHRHNLDTSNAITIKSAATGTERNVWSADTDNWTSGADALSGGDDPNWDHLGTYNSNLDTDNRPPFLAIYFIERYK